MDQLRNELNYKAQKCNKIHEMIKFAPFSQIDMKGLTNHSV